MANKKKYQFDPATAPLTMVQWVDSSSKSGRWTGIEELIDDAINDNALGHITTIGWIVHEDKDSVTIAGSISRHTNGFMAAGEIIIIPTSCVRQWRLIQKGVPWLHAATET